MAGVEKAHLYRVQKTAYEFADDYLEGDRIVTPEDFIEAKEREVSVKEMCGPVQFNDDLVFGFYALLSSGDLIVAEEDRPEYCKVEDLLIAWERARLELVGEQ